MSSPDVHEVAVLQIATPSLNSSSSIATDSPTSLIPELPDIHSSHSTPTVKFAPLPQIDPSRKRCMVPLGVSGRSRRKQAIQQEALWCTDSDMPEENMDMEDPLVAFANFVKKTGKTLWQRVRKGSRAVVPQHVSLYDSYPAEPVLDITSTVEVVGEKRGGRVSWPAGIGKRRSHSLDDSETQRRSTNDLRVIV